MQLEAPKLAHEMRLIKGLFVGAKLGMHGHAEEGKRTKQKETGLHRFELWTFD